MFEDSKSNRPPLAARVQRLVASVGLARACAITGASRTTLDHLRGGVPTRKGSDLLVTTALDRFDALLAAEDCR